MFGFGSKSAANSVAATEAIEIPSNASLNAPRESAVEYASRQTSRHGSFQMELVNDGDAVGEQPQKVMDKLFNRPVVNSQELASRIESIKARDNEHLAPEHKAPIDPESRLYRGWLALLVTFASFSIATTGYYLCMYDIFSVMMPRLPRTSPRARVASHRWCGSS